jgi:enamine deaminase RidA (YjgF/YER057c/UK114 family)
VQCASNLLAHIEQLTGSLEQLRQVVRITVFVAAAPGFFDHSRVADAASARFVEILGDRGRHARSTVGVMSLPRNSPVEIDAVVELEHDAHL